MDQSRDTPSPRLRGEGGVRGVLAPAPHPPVGPEACPSPGSALRAASDLAPLTGRGDWLRSNFVARCARETEDRTRQTGIRGCRFR